MKGRRSGFDKSHATVNQVLRIDVLEKHVFRRNICRSELTGLRRSIGLLILHDNEKDLKRCVFAAQASNEWSVLWI